MVLRSRLCDKYDDAVMCRDEIINNGRYTMIKRSYAVVVLMVAVLFIGCSKEVKEEEADVIPTPTIELPDTSDEEDYDKDEPQVVGKADDGKDEHISEEELIRQDTEGAKHNKDAVSKEDLANKLVKGNSTSIADIKKQIKDGVVPTRAVEEEKKAEKGRTDTRITPVPRDKRNDSNIDEKNEEAAMEQETKPVKKRTDIASIDFDGTEVLASIKVNSVKRGNKAVELLKDAEDDDGASFGAVANTGYEIVVVNFKVTLPSNTANYNGDCIPDIRVRGKDGKLINGEAVYVYTGELGDYENNGRTKTYDIVFEIPEIISKYSIQFGTYGADNYMWYSK